MICAGILLFFTTDCKKDEPAKIPLLSTSGIADVTATSATGGGNISSDGGATITAHGVCWSTTPKPTISDSKTVDGSGTGQFVSIITGLTAGTTYHIMAYATNSVGTAYGAEISFTTSGQSPSCLTQQVTNVSATEATLNGIVNANDVATTVTFEYGTTTSYGSIATASQSPVTGNANTNVSTDISGLVRGTTYHFRVKAENSLGVVYGSDIEFQTIQVPTITSIRSDKYICNWGDIEL